MADALRLVEHFKLSLDDFRKEHCDRDEEGKLALKQHQDHSCVFLDDAGCTINAVKPEQCSGFPMTWRDSESFDYCEGIRQLT